MDVGHNVLEASLSWRNKCLDVLSAGGMCVLEENISLLRQISLLVLCTKKKSVIVTNIAKNMQIIIMP
jgi:hypothetical protein